MSNATGGGFSIRNTANTISGVTSTFFGATTGYICKTASHTPGLKKIVNPSVHCGFWDAYSVVREFVHGVLRRELAVESAHVYFTGHSLGRFDTCTCGS